MDSFICELNSNIKVMSTSFHDNISISVADVCEAVNKTKPGKTEGCSELMFDHIKYGTHKLYVILTMLFNSMFIYSITPSRCNDSCIVPIPKKCSKVIV